MTLEERVERLEAAVQLLDMRSQHLVPYGPIKGPTLPDLSQLEFDFGDLFKEIKVDPTL